VRGWGAAGFIFPIRDAGAIKGIFTTTVEVAGQTVTVRGQVMDGVVNLSTAFIP
jgi:hypothetical protein